MIAEARKLDRPNEVSIRYVEAKAESTGLDGGTADVVTAGQCWHWFDQPRVIAEVIRLLMLAVQFPENALEVPHRVFAIIGEASD
jgi:ubiquinone/menaquinone biosynthesis C-methylase UbiE